MHPDTATAKAFADTSKRTVELAAKLGVPVVIDFSGCPGDSDAAEVSELGDLPLATLNISMSLTGNGKKRKSPPSGERTYGKFAKDHGVKIAIEMHPGFGVYSLWQTMLRLNCAPSRATASAAITIRSHMFWQSIDPIKAVRVLGDCIFHVHAKDTQIYDSNLPKTGVLDTKKYTDERNRSWIFRTVAAMAIPTALVERIHLHVAHVPATITFCPIEHEDSPDVTG